MLFIKKMIYKFKYHFYKKKNASFDFTRQLRNFEYVNITYSNHTDSGIIFGEQIIDNSQWA